MNAPVLTYHFEPTRPGVFQELDEVRLLEPTKTSKGEPVLAGSAGTVLAVWAGGEAYEIEFDAGVVTVKAALLVSAD